jgi:predicted transglutaminase-like cysteine proteinase
VAATDRYTSPGAAMRSRHTRLIHIGAAIILVVIQIQPPTAHAYPLLWGTRETQSDNLRPFQRWLSMLERYVAERMQLDVPCTPNTPVGVDRCILLHQWKVFLNSIAGRDRQGQIDAVNQYMNAHPYVTDLVNWGIDNYWETPGEFLERNGNCKDYAIAKFLSLRLLGFENDALRVVVLRDFNLHLDHAILAVYIDNTIYALDNQIKVVVSADQIRHYKPYYSINEVHWWLHRQQ